MRVSEKLTKKQKKAQAFRERGKHTKGKGKDAIDSMANDVPVEEDQDMADIQGDSVEVSPVETKHNLAEAKGDREERGKGRGTEKGGDEEGAQSVGKQKKRKRDADMGTTEEAGAEEPKRRKKKGTADDDSEGAKPADGEKQEVKKVVQSQVKQRFLLFVGNLKYTTSLDAVKKHFETCDPPPTIRLLTPKPSSNKPAPNKSKGCAFLEFTHRNALQQALKLHQSELEGRRINVELTAGGGGKSEKRISKVKERNKGLDDQRKQRTEKAAENGEVVEMLPARPQRYSATSGIEQAPVTRRTWTVGDIADDGEVHRGGKRHTKERKPRGKQWGTGVNAIPVG